MTTVLSSFSFLFVCHSFSHILKRTRLLFESINYVFILLYVRLILAFNACSKLFSFLMLLLHHILKTLFICRSGNLDCSLSSPSLNRHHCSIHIRVKFCIWPNKLLFRYALPPLTHIHSIRLPSVKLNNHMLITFSKFECKWLDVWPIFEWGCLEIISNDSFCIKSTYWKLRI